jgi:NAD(P) transhydrogenase subunit beta
VSRLDAIAIAYLIASMTFILGLRFLSSPVTAKLGNRVAACGMALALIATFFTPNMTNYAMILVAVVIGAVVGSGTARGMKMTAMPQLVAIFNGMGGGAAALVSSLDIIHQTSGGASIQHAQAATIGLGAAIGSVSFAGSIIAFAKLQELMKGSFLVRESRYLNGALAIIVLALIAVLGSGTTNRMVLAGLLLVAVVLGFTVVLPIGGADMPVVISLMNSLTGIAVALTGFVINQEILIVSGALVGASGTLLTLLMARAMNRPLTNVLFGGMGAAPSVAGVQLPPGATVREISVDDAAVLMTYSQRVVIVPGYGLAVAQAQHQARELADVLGSAGVQVKYAIHPVAGRMPGHMNVLLAEADVPYDQVYEMDAINGEFPSTDVVLVVGANDITNPGARDDPSSAIYGMPILNVDYAQHVIVLKRSMRPGFAGIDNPLYYNPKTAMLFGDAKASLQKLVAATKNVARPREKKTKEAEAAQV